MGDSAGIGPEIVAKTAASGFLNDVCRPLIIGDMRVLKNAFTIIGKSAECFPVSAENVLAGLEDAYRKSPPADPVRGIPVLDRKNQDPGKIIPGQLRADCGKAVLDMLAVSCDLCRQGIIQGFCFAPLNKAAMIEAGSFVYPGKHFSSEHEFLADLLGVSGVSGEINVLNEFSTTRITSHIPLKDVSACLSEKRILDAVSLAYRTVLGFGVKKPRVAVAALNPHAGDSGKCGTEEILIIRPAIEKARELGMEVQGPFSADTLFLRAFNGEFDSVVTMYHDQGQIAMKLKGFERGVTVAGGMPYPIATPAHGTAFDIAGKGIAGTSAFESALKLVARMIANAGGTGYL